MKNLKILLLAIVATLVALPTFAQTNSLEEGNLQLNAGVGTSNWGTPLFVGIDYGITEDITIGGELSFRSKTTIGISYSAVAITANGNYHFNRILDIPSELDVYSGVSLGYFSWSTDNSMYNAYSSGLELLLQMGGRYFFTEEWGANMQIEIGNVTGLKVGVTYRF